MALALPETAWTEIAWREGTNGELASRFARTRVRAAHADTRLSAPREEEWLPIEWPEGEPEPTQYWLSTLPEETGFADLVDLAQLRWRIERDYQDLKQEVGFGRYEGRGWRGFHHHATLCIAAYGFLIAERARFSPLRPKSRRGFRSASPFRGLPTPRRRQSDPNGTCRTRSPPCDDGSPWRWSGACIDARAAHAQIRAIAADPSSIAACDAVVLERHPPLGGARQKTKNLKPKRRGDAAGHLTRSARFHRLARPLPRAALREQAR